MVNSKMSISSSPFCCRGGNGWGRRAGETVRWRRAGVGVGGWVWYWLDFGGWGQRWGGRACVNCDAYINTHTRQCPHPHPDTLAAYHMSTHSLLTTHTHIQDSVHTLASYHRHAHTRQCPHTRFLPYTRTYKTVSTLTPALAADLPRRGPIGPPRRISAPAPSPAASPRIFASIHIWVGGVYAGNE